MAIFSYRMGDRVSRSAGQSAVKAAAYQARENYTDERTGYAYNHRPREREQAEQEPARGVAAASAYIGREAGYDAGAGRKPALFVGLYAPSGAPDWCRGRENIEQFWSRAELAEKQPRAQIAERIIVALPHELNLQQNIWLLQDHVKEFTRQGRVVQVAIHAPEHGDGRNIHAHLLVATRGVDAHGFKASKAAEQQERYLYRRQYVEGLRARWAEATNRHLARHGYEARVDHRPLAEQGIDRAPTIHLGPGDSRREWQGERSVGGEVNREIAARNAEREPRTREAREGHERVRELTTPHVRPLRPAREAVETREPERAPAAPPAVNPAPDAPERGQERQKVSVLERSGHMIRSAFERTLDWIAPRVEEPHLQPPPPCREPEKPAPERPLPLPLYERIALRAQEREHEREREDGRDRDPGFRREDSALYERYKVEREAAWQTRRAAEREVRASFATQTQDRRGFYDRQFEEVKNSRLRGVARYEAMQRLMAQQRAERAATHELRQQQLVETRQAHPVPEWDGWLKREAAKGDRDAARALERHEAREAEAEKGYTEEKTPLYEHYEAEREAAQRVREAAERTVHERFAAYTQDLRGFYTMRFEQEKHSGMPGPVRHDAMELLAAQRRGDRGHAIRLEREQIAGVRRAHPLPSWEEYLKREASKGDKEAVRALERFAAREAERNRDRDDDGRGIEP
jgi:hypothetical protein